MTTLLRYAFGMALRGVVQRLREMREESGITQQEIAVAIGVTRQQVSQFETGYRGTTVERLEAYADTVGCRLLLQVVAKDAVLQPVLVDADVAETAAWLQNAPGPLRRLAVKFLRVLPHLTRKEQKVWTAELEIHEAEAASATATG